jgi:hypothetical protein
MIIRTAALGFALLCGVAASQIPEFVQQYRQRLGGALDELTAIVRQFDVDAAGVGMDRPKAIATLNDNPDPLARGRGRAMQDAVQRRERLADQDRKFRTDGPLARLVAFAEDFDPQLASRTWADFEPAVPTTPEGLVCAGAGALGGYGFLRLIVAPFRLRRRVPA